MNTSTLVNGEEGQSIPVLDRGLSYGDGLFETLLVSAGRPIFLQPHLERLDLGCARIGLPVTDHQIWQTEIQSLVANQMHGSLKLIYTRGIGPRGFAPPPEMHPTRIVQFQPGASVFCRSKGMRVRFCSHPLSIQPALAGIKHLNQLDRVLARAEWTGADPEEGIMFDPNGQAIEGTMSNLFLVKKGTLYTPNLDQCGIAGIIRKLVLDHAARLKMPCHVTHINQVQLMDADEIFMTNSLIGIAPVMEIDQKRLALGPVTQTLQLALLNHMQNDHQTAST